ncbi:MAG: transcriptional regulator [Deltaproteobacteria bacterium]|nr:transcriptional regulator [Deltaproteobacteria bacterium]
MTDGQIGLGDFRVDPRNETLWHGARELRVRPKAFTVLLHLLNHAGQLVTKDELLRVVWPDTVVSEAALSVSIGELRRKLGDDAKTPRYIETVHRRGFRFVGKVANSQEGENQKAKGKRQKAKIKRQK